MELDHLSQTSMGREANDKSDLNRFDQHLIDPIQRTIRPVSRSSEGNTPEVSMGGK